MSHAVRSSRLASLALASSIALPIALTILAVPWSARAEAVKPRFLIVVDSSGSMTENPGRVRVHGDGSQDQLGCDLDGNGRYDDSKLYQAKAALNDTIAAFGSAEFSLARYHQTELGQACTTNGNCTALNNGATTCFANACGFAPPQNGTDYDECSGGSAVTNGCIRCADPNNDRRDIHYFANTCCGAGDPTAGSWGMAGDVLVPFPSSGGKNYNDLLSWMDGVETFPAGDNHELRATGVTPIGGALNAVRDWLINDASVAGPSGGVLNRDAQVDCRSYNVILITDGVESATCTTSCGINGDVAADQLYHACTNGGLFDFVDNRCEINGNPQGTRRIKVRTYVVGFTVNDPSLNGIAAAGGTNIAVLANDQAELTARLGDIIAGSIPAEKCNCQDDTCDNAVDETFATKGQTCTVGVGRCKRQGVYGCKADGSGVVCSATAAGICPAQELQAGTGVTEQCGAAAGCLAPTPEDCADDDCNGLVDENLSCACTAKPEVCNGLDDDCNGQTDDVPTVACGLSIGECIPGTTVCMADGAGGKKTVCVGGRGPVLETCNGKDDDCDGITDAFGTACYPAGAVGCKLGATADSCGGGPLDKWTCTGICQPGLTTCTDGICSACARAVTPLPEVACDGLDNDCNGMTDEGFGLGTACGPGISGKGACKPGVLSCVDQGLRCVGGIGPVEEVCNGKDDDCDGVTDNIPGACGFTKGECKPGAWRCVAGAPVCDQPFGPTAEVCNGKDDDCDGMTDDAPTDPDIVTPTACGNNVGVCKPGLLKCLGGGKYCDGSVEPVREKCNALDDDCNGKVDDGVNSPGACPPPGLPATSPVVGECRPGTNVCAPDGSGGATWMCQGGVGPTAEICDGKDQDCDGVADNDAPCPVGMACAFGECVLKCSGGEIDCPPDRTCKDGLCIQNECVRTACGFGFYCDPRRGCVDKCEGRTCLAGQRCENGICTSCFLTGCKAGELCRGPVCEPDPCLNKDCGGGAYCTNGTCKASCAGVKCGSGQACHGGVCSADKCQNKTCASGAFCNPTTGACEANPCNVIVCIQGQVCAPLKAACVPNACIGTACKGNDVCVIRPDGEAECVDKSTLPEYQPTRVATGGGAACSCELGDRTDARGFPGLWALGVGLLLVVRRRRGGGRS